MQWPMVSKIEPGFNGIKPRFNSSKWIVVMCDDQWSAELNHDFSNSRLMRSMYKSEVDKN